MPGSVVVGAIEVERGLVAKVKAFCEDETGATMVEYALIMALIVVASILVVTQLQQSVGNSLTKQKTYFEGAK